MSRIPALPRAWARGTAARLAATPPSSLHELFEAVDQSPLVLGDAAFPLPSAKHPDVGTETYG